MQFFKVDLKKHTDSSLKKSDGFLSTLIFTKNVLKLIEASLCETNEFVFRVQRIYTDIPREFARMASGIG